MKGAQRGVVRRRPTTRAAQYVALAAYLIFLGFPLLWMLSVSFKGPRELVELHPSFWPSDPTLENYRLALNDSVLIHSAVNSLKIATFTALLTTLIGLPAAYVLARRRGGIDAVPGPVRVAPAFQRELRAVRRPGDRAEVQVAVVRRGERHRVGAIGRHDGARPPAVRLQLGDRHARAVR